MKDILVLLLLLNAQTTKVCSQPYQVDSNGKCLHPATEYASTDGSDLCCKKCPAGERLIRQCTQSTETQCERCPHGQFIEGINFSENCLSCTKCKATKGLQVARNCSSNINSKCQCLPGMYCIMGFEAPYCAACERYRLCRAGFGVSAAGTADSDVRCKRCPDGTFSDRVSSIEPCRPHTNCNGAAIIKKGDSTSDNVCEPIAFTPTIQPQILTKVPHAETVFTTVTTMRSIVPATSDPKTPHSARDSTLSTSHLPSALEPLFNQSTENPPTDFDSTLVAAVIASVFGSILVFIVLILVLCYSVTKKDSTKFHPKVDANGNCESADKINQGYLGETHQTSFTLTMPEHECLLEKGEGCSDQSQSSNNTETLTRTDGCSSTESIGPLQSTVALHSPPSALSEPMTLLSNTEPVTPQTSIPSQPSSQPTSPQIISPVTPSPQFNVNITFHIGNGSGGTPSVTPADLMQVNSKLPYGEEEESFSIPQQEAGKQSLMSVQESESDST